MGANLDLACNNRIDTLSLISVLRKKQVAKEFLQESQMCIVQSLESYETSKNSNTDLEILQELLNELLSAKLRNSVLPYRAIYRPNLNSVARFNQVKFSRST